MKQNLLKVHAIQEGLFFLFLGGALLWYGLEKHFGGFNHDWSQSPYLFPVMVAVLLGALAMSLLYQGLHVAGNISTAADSPVQQSIRVAIVLAMSVVYYFLLAVLKIPYITFGIFTWSFTISNFEVVTLLFLIALMLYLGVRRLSVLASVPLGVTLFLSITFRAMLHVLLP